MTTTYPNPIQARVNVAAKAQKVATIFDILAILVLVVGGLAAGFVLLASFIGAVSDSSSIAFFPGLLLALFIGVYTALTWASITLATVVAGYIANRTI